MDADPLPVSRQAWGDLETLHVVGYFAPEVTSEYVELGLHPRLSYFPARAAAFGEAGPGLTIATFYVFAPWLVEAVLPAAWQTTTPSGSSGRAGTGWPPRCAGSSVRPTSARRSRSRGRCARG